jgi:protease PrsW
MSLPKPPDLRQSINPGMRGHSDKVITDLKALRKHLLLPVEEIRSMRWVQDHKLIGILLLGLFPIAALTLFRGAPQTVYWCFGFYFSVIWALFFYHFFTPVGATRTNAVIAFFGTGVVSMAVLLTLLGVGFETFRDSFLASPDFFIRIAANIFTVGVPEEICKLLVILYLLRSGPSLPSIPTMVFYGLMSGLGFGIYEGMNYQMGANFNSVAANSNLVTGIAVYYFENLLRLTTLPFLHAMWTAIGAYFLSLGQLYPSRRHGLWAAALGIPAILHGLHDSFSDPVPWASFAVDFVSVFALMIYLSRSQELEKVLQDEPGAPPPGVLPGA